MKFNPALVFVILCISFLIYSFTIYLIPLSIGENSNFKKKKASEGRIVWQDNNCQSCHQLYGLGGYLGPDLTNIISTPKKGEPVIRAMIKSGVKQMPAFDMTDEETNNLIEFLKSVDASGKADPRNFVITNDGMIEQYEKK